MFRFNKNSKEKPIAAVTDEIGNGSDEAESIGSRPKPDKKKSKKKKSRANAPISDSPLTFSSPESKAKKKKSKSKSPNGEKKKSKKSPKKDQAVSIDGSLGRLPLHARKPKHLDDKDDTLESDGEASLQDGKSCGTLEDDINDEDDLDMAENRQIFDSGPPIGEILACSTDGDDVSDIGEELLVDGPPSTEIIDGVQIFYNPSDADVCFDDRHHPGTMDWIEAIRECMDRFEDKDYSPPVYRAIKKQLKGRKFLVRARSNVRTSWREATKPEIIELFGEAFNEERRRVREGIADDDSGVDSSLQNSAAQSETSLSVGDIAGEELPARNNKKDSLPTPSSRPTPRASNQEGAAKTSSPYDFDGDSENDSDVHLDARGKRKNEMSTENISTSEKHLLHAMREIEVAEEYARPFDNVTLLQQGRMAEEKLNMLIHLSHSSKTSALKAELEKLEEFSTMMKIASLAPLLDIVTKIERHVTDYYNSMAEMHSSSLSLKIAAKEFSDGVNRNHKSVQKTKFKPTKESKNLPHRSLEDDPRSDVDTDREASHSHNGVHHRRTINVSSHHGRHERSKSSRASGGSSSPSKSKSKSGSQQVSEQMNQSALSFYADHSEAGEELTMTRPATASTDDVNSMSTDAHERMNSEANLEDLDSPITPADAHRQLHEMPLRMPLRTPDYDVSMQDMALGGSSMLESGLSIDDMASIRSDAENSGSEYSGQLKDSKATGLTYENSVRTADFGGSYREMALGGGYENSGDLATSGNDGFGESGLGSHVQTSLGGDLGDSEDEDDDEEEFEVEGGEDELDDETPLNVAEGHVLDLQSDEADDLSSMGRSAPGMYGSDSESDNEKMGDEVHEVGDDQLNDEDNDESDFSDSSDDDEVDKSRRTEQKEKPNPKLDQFFDRLQHFFEVRKKMDERVDIVDPSSKLQGLKVKVHSDGIQKKSGKFKKEYQQRNLKGKVARNLDELYGPADIAREELSRLLSLLVSDIKGMERGSYTVLPLKQRNKAFEKAQEEYAQRSPGPPESWLYDVVRASIYCKSFKQIADVSKWIGKNSHIVSSKNRFKEPCFNGYRDLIFHVSIPYKDDLAHICEIQVHHKDIKALDEQFGTPKHYEYFRSAFAGLWRSEALILEDLGMLNKYGEIGGQCMVKLLKSKDPDQLRLFARLCRDKLDEFDRSLELYRRILLLQQATLGEDNDDVADTYLGLGIVLGALGDVDESLLNLEKALAIKESLLGTEHLEVADTYAKIGNMLCQKGDYQGALRKHQDALTVRESNLGREHFLVIRSLQDIGRALRDTGDFMASEAELRRALGIQEAVLGDSNIDVAVTRSMIGVTLCEYGDYSRAMEEHRHALTIFEAKVGKNNSWTADAHDNIGIVLCQRGDYEVAEWRHRKALRIHEAVSGKDAEACAVCLTHLGEVLKRKGDYDGAIKVLKRACKIREDHLGMDHPISAGSHLDLGKIYVSKRKDDQALEESRKAKVVRESFLGPLHPHTAEAYNYVGNALTLKGDHDAAIVEHKQALSIYEAVLGKNHPKTATGYHFMADALLAMGNKDEALNEHRQALAIRANVLNKDHPDTALSCSRIGSLLSQKGDLVGASVAYRQALSITVTVFGEDHPEAATIHIQVARVLAASGDVAEAMEGVTHALEVRESSLGKDHPDTARAYGVLGTLHSMMGNPTDAKKCHKKSVSILDGNLGKKSPSAKAARHRLEAVDKQGDNDILGDY